MIHWIARKISIIYYFHWPIHFHCPFLQQCLSNTPPPIVIITGRTHNNQHVMAAVRFGSYLDERIGDGKFWGLRHRSWSPTATDTTINWGHTIQEESATLQLFTINLLWWNHTARTLYICKINEWIKMNDVTLKKNSIILKHCLCCIYLQASLYWLPLNYLCVNKWITVPDLLFCLQSVVMNWFDTI